MLHHRWILESFVELGQAQVLGYLLKEDLDEDSAGRGCFIFVQMDVLQHRPWKGIRMEQVREELGHVPQLVGFESVDALVLLDKALVKSGLVFVIDEAETLSH